MEIMHKGMWTGRRVLYLSVDAIRANPDQPRKYFEPEALRELAESIGRYGILQPLTVRRGEDGYELIAGERRLRAAKLAGLREVPCLAVRSDEEKSALLSLSRQIIFFVPAAVILPVFMGVKGVLWTRPVADGLAFVLSLALIVYERKQLKKVPLSE